MKKIEIINGTTQLNPNYDTLNVSSDKTNFELSIIIDDNPGLTNYNIECNSNGFIVFQNIGNTVYVTVNENNSCEDRSGFINFTHTMDKNVFYTLNFIQSKRDYSIDAEYEGTHENIEITFNTLTDKQDLEYEEYYVNINCTNGNRDFVIKNIEEYSNAEMTKKIPFDNGFEIKKVNSHLLKITNFGKISTLYNVRYKITLCHKNNRKNCKEIIIKYNNPDTGSGFGFDDD